MELEVLRAHWRAIELESFLMELDRKRFCAAKIGAGRAHRHAGFGRRRRGQVPVAQSEKRVARNVRPRSAAEE